MEEIVAGLQQAVRLLLISTILGIPLGDRAWLETVTPSMLGKETWADVGLSSDHSHLLLSGTATGRGDEDVRLAQCRRRF